MTLLYRQCGLLMVAETVSLGVLSLPAAVAGLGFVPYVSDLSQNSYWITKRLQEPFAD